MKRLLTTLTLTALVLLATGCPQKTKKGQKCSLFEQPSPVTGQCEGTAPTPYTPPAKSK